MACFRPYQGWRAITGGVTFSPSKAWRDLPPLTIPCGKCIGCRLGNSQDWSTRITHEASYHDASCFLTLTYDNEHLPHDYSISIPHLQLFNKRLRKACGPFRFFACGEYGGETLRPHYHLILFGLDFATTRVPWRKTARGHVTYRSPLLEKIWTYGHSEIGSVTPASAGYVARYQLKKVSGKQADAHYTRLHPLTGEICRVRPEFITMSTKPGLGRRWIDQYKGDAFPSDFVVIDGKKRPVPRYYTKQLSEESPDTKLWSEKDQVKNERIENARQHADNNTPDRLAIREEIQENRAERLKRELETDQ